MSFIIFALLLTFIGYIYLYFPPLRLWAMLLMGLVYFLGGIYRHWQEKTLHRSVVLEYLVLALLGMSLLYFLNLRA